MGNSHDELAVTTSPGVIMAVIKNTSTMA